MTAISHNETPRLVHIERQRQLSLWGEQNHPDGTTTDNEPIAQAAKQSCDLAFATGKGTWFDILLEEVMETSAEENEAALYIELIQVAAVAESWADAILRRQAERESTIDAIENSNPEDLIVAVKTVKAIEGAA